MPTADKKMCECDSRKRGEGDRRLTLYASTSAAAPLRVWASSASRKHRTFAGTNWRAGNSVCTLSGQSLHCSTEARFGMSEHACGGAKAAMLHNLAKQLPTPPISPQHRPHEFPGIFLLDTMFAPAGQ